MALLILAFVANYRSAQRERLTNEPDIAHLPRLICTPHRRNFGRMRLLLDAVNAAELE